MRTPTPTPPPSTSSAEEALQGEVLRALLDHSKGNDSKRRVVDVFDDLPADRRRDWQVSDVEDLEKSLRDCPQLFELSTNDVTGLSSVTLTTTLTLCSKHSACAGSCLDNACADLHFCRFFLLSGRCPFDDDCHFGHELATDHNERLLRAHLLSALNVEDLRALLCLKRVRKGITCPRTCRYYNRMEDCDKGVECHYLHLCEFYIKGQCKFQSGCKRNHDIHHPQVKQVLDLYGIRHDGPHHTQDTILKELQAYVQRAQSVHRQSSSGVKRKKTSPHQNVAPTGSKGKTTASKRPRLAKQPKGPEVCIYHLQGRCRFGRSCDKVHTNDTFQWYFAPWNEEAAPCWTEFDSQDNQFLEGSFWQPACDGCYLRKERSVLAVEFEDMTAYVRGTGEKFKVARASTPSSLDPRVKGDSPEATVWLWYWQHPHLGWTLFDHRSEENAEERAAAAQPEVSSETVERQFLAGRSGRIMLPHHVLDFRDMSLQERSRGGTFLQVRRRPQDRCASAATTTGPRAGRPGTRRRRSSPTGSDLWSHSGSIDGVSDADFPDDEDSTMTRGRRHDRLPSGRGLYRGKCTPESGDSEDKEQEEEGDVGGGGRGRGGSFWSWEMPWRRQDARRKGRRQRSQAGRRRRRTSRGSDRGLGGSPSPPWGRSRPEVGGMDTIPTSNYGGRPKRHSGSMKYYYDNDSSPSSDQAWRGRDQSLEPERDLPVSRRDRRLRSPHTSEFSRKGFSSQVSEELRRRSRSPQFSEDLRRIMAPQTLEISRRDLFPQTSEVSRRDLFPQTSEVSRRGLFSLVSEVSRRSRSPQTSEVSRRGLFSLVSEGSRRSRSPQTSEVSRRGLFSLVSEGSRRSRSPQTSEVSRRGLFSLVSEGSRRSRSPQTSEVSRRGLFSLVSEGSRRSRSPQTSEVSRRGLFPQTSEVSRRGRFIRASEVSRRGRFTETSEVSRRGRFTETSEVSRRGRFIRASEVSRRGRFIRASEVSRRGRFKETSEVSRRGR
ncbi:uncharacterized protein LOC143287353 [Babylonia areolata]|uniref:uncharacterized protein LOC143287353 n=1 Tax=Babylonia areolata TaxID=304850 RepID=UPI003FD48AB1